MRINTATLIRAVDVEEAEAEAAEGTMVAVEAPEAEGAVVAVIVGAISKTLR